MTIDTSVGEVDNVFLICFFLPDLLSYLFLCFNSLVQRDLVDIALSVLPKGVFDQLTSLNAL